MEKHVIHSDIKKLITSFVMLKLPYNVPEVYEAWKCHSWPLKITAQMAHPICETKDPSCHWPHMGVYSTTKDKQ